MGVLLIYFCSQGKLSTNIDGIDHGNEMAEMERWGAYLEEHLSFPFDAEVDEWQDRGPLQSGDRVSVKKISSIEDLYGVVL